MPGLRAVVDAVFRASWEADSDAIRSYLHLDFVLHEPPTLPAGAAHGTALIPSVANGINT